MLEGKTLEVVKNSVPVLAEHGETVTKRFYEILFQRYPELKNLFNMSHQAAGGNQPKALANAVFAFARYCETPEVLGPMVNRIAHKHTSLAVKAEHYPIVGECLLAALGDVLGLEPDHEIIVEWGNAFGALAKVFIDHEASLYKAAEDKQGGWVGFRQFVVSKIEQETELVKSFYFKPTDNEALPSFEAGQYVSVKLSGAHVDSMDFDYEAIRQYSLSDIPNGEYLRVSIKAEPGNPKGVVSNYLHSVIKAGDKVQLSPPSGDFVLNKAASNAVFISGGIGITPMFSMLKQWLTSEGEQSQVDNTTFIHCAQKPELHALQDELSELESQHAFSNVSIYDQDDSGDYHGFFDETALQKFVDVSKEVLEKTHFYFCGPQGFMAHVESLLLQAGADKSQLSYEAFGPTLELDAAS